MREGFRHNFQVPQSWHVGLELGLGLAKVWEKAGKGDTADGGRIHVAILDSGVANARGLPGERIAQYDPSGRPEQRRDWTSGFHGTQVVSVLASGEPEAIGIAPEARCSCFNVYGSQQRPMASRVSAALARAIAMKVDLICCTFSLERSSNELRQRIIAAHAAQIPILASASDTNKIAPFPDQTGGVICVAATTVLKTVLARPAGCSAKVAAPGVDILASTPIGVARFSGTSAAAPIATGVVALALAHARRRGVEAWFRDTLPELLVGTANKVTRPPSIDAHALLHAIEDKAS